MELRYNVGKSNEHYRIPVVFHVIYRLEDQNISDEQILGQLEVINKDFNRLNWDTMLVPAPWKNLIADVGIEFVLADRDPDGNIVSGITRTKTEVVDIASAVGNLHYYTDKGGQDIWDRDSYLNIYVCEIANGDYGFASFPGSPSAEDAVTIAFKSFGTSGTAEFPTDKGRTATHEIGHWFNLFHLWGVPKCGDDEVADTPQQEEPNFDCPFFPETSTCNSVENIPDGDMFVNFMDYVDDKCMNMFTLLQKERMLKTLTESRKSLLDSKGYNQINEQSDVKGISIYPNPSHNYTDIHFGRPLRNKANLEVNDISGRSMFKDNIPEGALKHRINTSNMDMGTYVVRIMDNNQDFNYTLRLVIKP